VVTLPFHAFRLRHICSAIIFASRNIYFHIISLTLFLRHFHWHYYYHFSLLRDDCGHFHDAIFHFVPCSREAKTFDDEIFSLLIDGVAIDYYWWRRFSFFYDYRANIFEIFFADGQPRDEADDMLSWDADVMIDKHFHFHISLIIT